MSDKENQKGQIKRLLNYLSNRLPDEERNLFEREMECDVFDREALDGFRKIGPDEVRKDLRSLHVGGIHAMPSKRFFLILGIIILIVILVLAAVFFIPLLKQKLEVRKQAETTIQTKPVAEQLVDSVQFETPITEAVDDTLVEEPTTLEVEEEAVKPLTDEAKISAEDYNLVINYKGRIVDATTKDPIQWAIVTVYNSNRQTITKSDGTFSIDLAGSTAPCFIVKFKKYIDKEFVLSKDSSETILMETEEAGQETSSISLFANVKKNIVDPTPSGGMSKFEKYLAENLVYPEDAKNLGTQIVQVNFLIKASGQPFNFEVTNSPGRAFTTETMRVISRGPWWNPATIDGEAVMGDMALKVVFKPQ